MNPCRKVIGGVVLFLIAAAPHGLSASCIVINSPLNNATVGGTAVSIKTTDTCSGGWFEGLKVDGRPSGTFPDGKVVFNSETVVEGNHTITVTSQSKNPGSVVLGVASVVVNVENSGQHYSMLGPAATLPSEAVCVSQVNGSLIPENAPWNENDGTGYNSNQPPSGGIPSYFYKYAPGASELPSSDFATVDGAFAGSTDDIFRVYACKWGIDEDYVRAQAFSETRWHQDCAVINGGTGCDDNGDYDKPNGCTLNLPVTSITPNGQFCGLQGLVASGSNQYDSWGLLQTKVYYAWMTWPMIQESTPFATDFHLAEMRGCVNGDQYAYFHSQNPSIAVDYQNAVNSAKTDPDGSSSSAGWTNLQYLAYGCIDTHVTGTWFEGKVDSYILRFLSHVAYAPWPGGVK
jgi:hypothetical protein